MTSDPLDRPAPVKADSQSPTDHAAPPVDFPVYGLDQGFSGHRWVDFFEGLPGEPAWALWLGHRERDSDSGVRVGSLPRTRYDEARCPGGTDPLREVAFSGAFGLVNLTLPEGSVPRPDGLIPALVEHAEHQAKAYRRWPLAQWEVDGRRLTARVWRFADAWAGFTDMLDDDYVVVIGLGTEPDGLRLARVMDRTAYGTDLGSPLDLTELGRHKSSRPEAWLPPPRRDGFHPDQLALLPEVAASTDRANAD